MNNFSDFKIEPRTNSFVGEKIPVKKLVGIPIEVHDFRIEPSKKVEGTDLLTMQIVKASDHRIVFTGSKGLIDQIQKVPRGKFPFTTTIKVENECYQFT